MEKILNRSDPRTPGASPTLARSACPRPATFSANARASRASAVRRYSFPSTCVRMASASFRRPTASTQSPRSSCISASRSSSLRHLAPHRFPGPTLQLQRALNDGHRLVEPAGPTQLLDLLPQPIPLLGLFLLPYRRHPRGLSAPGVRVRSKSTHSPTGITNIRRSFVKCPSRPPYIFGHRRCLTASRRRGRRRPRRTVAAVLAVPDVPGRHAASSSPASRAAPAATPRLLAPACLTTPGGRTAHQLVRLLVRHPPQTGHH